MNLSSFQKDGLLGLVFVSFAIVVYLHVSNYPAAAANFPKLIALTIFAPFGALLIVRCILQWRVVQRSAETVMKDDQHDPIDMNVRFDLKTTMMSIAIVLAFIGSGFLGFLESMALLALFSCALFGMRLLHSIIFIAFFCSVLVGFLFAMDIRLPNGPLSSLIFG